MEQIAIIRPRVICTLGRFATKLLADTELSMTVIHGKAKTREVAGVQTMIFPVFHPAAALYTPANRQVLEEDFVRLRRLLDRGLEALGAVNAAEEAAPEAPVGGQSPLSPGPGRATAPRTEQLPLW